MIRLLLSACLALVTLHTSAAADDGLPGTGPIRRFDWFQKLWLEKRTAWAKHLQDPR